MKLPGLLAPLLLGGGAVPALGKVEIVGDKALRSEGQVLLGKGLPYQGQDKPPVNQHIRDGASIHSAGANVKPIDLDALKIALPQENQTTPTLNIQRQDAPVITVKVTKSPPAAADSEPSTPDHDPDHTEPASAGASGGAQKRNPASANRAIAGMGAGLVSVMLVFVVFL